MDEFTLRHLDTWLLEHLPPDAIDGAKAKMIKLYDDDPEWWGAQGWLSLALASNVWGQGRSRGPEDW